MRLVLPVANASLLPGQIWTRSSSRLVPRCLRNSTDKHRATGTSATGSSCGAEALDLVARNAIGRFNCGGALRGAVGSLSGTCESAGAWDARAGMGSGNGMALVYYPSVRVCEACFELHKMEMMLMEAERRLARFVGAAKSTGIDDDESGKFLATRKREASFPPRDLSAKALPSTKVHHLNRFSSSFALSRVIPCPAQGSARRGSTPS